MTVLDIYSRGSHKSDKRITPIAGQEKGCKGRIESIGAKVGKVSAIPASRLGIPK